MKKRLAAVLLTLCVCLLFPYVAMAAVVDSVENPDFEYIDAEGMPQGWQGVGYRTDRDASTFEADYDIVFNGEASVSVENHTPNDARFEQTIVVESNTYYKISCYIRAEGIPRESAGANLSLINCWGTSNQLWDTGGEWEKVEAYVLTGMRDKTITLALRVGMYGQENTGKAWFDTVEVEEVDQAPYGETVLRPYQFVIMDILNNPDAMYFLSIIGIGMGAVLMLILYKKGLLIQKGIDVNAQPDNTGATAALVLAIGLLVRILVVQLSPGYRFDMGCFSAWAQRAASLPMADFYSADFFCDYPPGYLYILAVVGKLCALLGIESTAWVYGLLRIPSCLADVACAYLLYRFAHKTWGWQMRGALLIAALYLFNPAPIFDSAAWGQMDGILALAVIGGVMLASKKKYMPAAALFAIGVTLKPQGLIFLPVLLYPMLADLFPAQEEKLAMQGDALKLVRRKAALKLAGALLTGVAVFAVIVTPFITKLGPAFLIDLYQETIGSYPYFSVNAANVWGALGSNWVLVGGGVGWTIWTYVVIAGAIAGSAWVYFRSRKPQGLVMSALVLLMTLFLLAPRMHERYALVALPLLLLLLIMTRDRRAFWCTLGLSVTMSLNMMMCLFTVHIPSDDPLFIIVSVAQILLAAALFFVVFLINERREIKPLEEKMRPEKRVEKEPREKITPLVRLHAYQGPKPRMRLTLRDWAILFAVTLVYAAVALTNLGDTQASQTYWKSEEAGEAFVVDMGNAYAMTHVYYYAGIGEGNLMLEYSLDGDTWTDLIKIENKYGHMYCWQPLQAEVTARYVRVAVTKSGMTLYEMAFKDAEHRTLPIASVEHLGKEETGENRIILAFDEQSLVPDIPTYMNSMYFDEIYHARTGFEHLHQMVPYEVTHPPLGKVIIMAGISIFGMTPFGWRIAGTVMGILMVPVIFLLVKRITGKTRWAAVATILMTFDFMHYVQTRIATIDSYAVLLIMLMYWFMYRYVSMNMHKEKLIATLKPLMLCGLFFGLGAASKWICIYAGAGLAVMLGISIVQRIREYRAAMDVPREEWDEHEALYTSMQKRFWRNIWLTLLWCVLWFIIVPVAIYVASYYPIMLVEGYEWKWVWENQLYMFGYHSKLTEGHSFGSDWYEWLINARPIWFYDAPLLPKGMTGGISSFGNPAVWLPGLAALGWMIYRAVADGFNKARDKWFVLIAFASQLLPWVFVSRTTFIYHYFASVPFLILCIVFFLREWVGKNAKRMKWVWIYCGVVVLLFAVFYPLLTGTPIELWYARLLRWSPTWVLFRG